MKPGFALVAGGSGFIGRCIIDHLLSAGWDVIALARKPPAITRNRWISIDLTRLEDCRAKLAGIRNVSHLFYAARFDHPEGMPESVEINDAMLRNLVTTVESAGALRHVHAVHGSKYYGYRAGEIVNPMREDAPRGNTGNYYFAQQDFLHEHSAGKDWTYSTSRPHIFCDAVIDQPRSVGLLIAVFAAIQKELGEPLDFPGNALGYRVLSQFTDLKLLARAAEWMAQDSRCANQSFNVVNGDTPSWADLWPGFAGFFGMRVGVPTDINLADYMADKGKVWDAVVRKHGLRSTRLEELVLWPYGDTQFRRQRDAYSSMDKARALGFHDRVNSAEMFARHFDYFRAEKIIPTY